VIKKPWPGMMRTVFKDHARFEQTYFSAFKVCVTRGWGGVGGGNWGDWVYVGVGVGCVWGGWGCRLGWVRGPHSTHASFRKEKSPSQHPPMRPSTAQGYYFTGDGCRRDEDGYYWITGRVDDVLNVSGHRWGGWMDGWVDGCGSASWCVWRSLRVGVIEGFGRRRMTNHIECAWRHPPTGSALRRWRARSPAWTSARRRPSSGARWCRTASSGGGGYGALALLL